MTYLKKVDKERFFEFSKSIKLSIAQRDYILNYFTYILKVNPK